MATTETPPALDSDSVHEFVANAHGDLEAVRNALASEPALVNASWDWGGGDWETALGAAAHMGRRDIAEWLLAHGARLDVFAAAMLGEIEVVRAVLSAQPEVGTVSDRTGSRFVRTPRPVASRRARCSSCSTRTFEAVTRRPPRELRRATSARPHASRRSRARRLPSRR